MIFSSTWGKSRNIFLMPLDAQARIQLGRFWNSAISPRKALLLHIPRIPHTPKYHFTVLVQMDPFGHVGVVLNIIVFFKRCKGWPWPQQLHRDWPVSKVPKLVDRLMNLSPIECKKGHLWNMGYINNYDANMLKLANWIGSRKWWIIMTMCFFFEFLKRAVGWILMKNTRCWWVSGAKTKIAIRSCHHHSVEHIVNWVSRGFVPFHTLKLYGMFDYIYCINRSWTPWKRRRINPYTGWLAWPSHLGEVHGWSALIPVNRGKILKKISDIWHKM